MKKILLGLSSCLMLSTTVFVVSCSKKNEGKPADVKKLKALSAQFNFSDFPTVSDGMLVFRDGKQYDDYLDFLDKATTPEDPEAVGVDAHKILKDIETGLGYTSIREISHSAFEALNETGWQTLEEIPDEHFINSIDLKSVLNQDLDVKIGDKIVHYINREYMVEIDAAAGGDLLNEYHKLNDKSGLTDILLLDKDNRFTTVRNSAGTGFVITPKPTGTDPGFPLFIFKPAVSYPDPCNNPRLVRLTAVALIDMGTWLPGYFEISWGDATPVTQKWSNSMNYNQVDPFEHTYATNGMKIIRIKGYNYQGGGQVAQRTDTIYVGGSTCQITERDSYTQYHNIDGTRGIGGRLYIEKYGSGNQKMRCCAVTESLQWKSGMWKFKSGRIEVELDCSAKDNNCVEIDHLVGYGLGGDQNDKLIHRSKDINWSWSQAVSTHYLTVYDTRFQFQVTLNSCP